MNALDWAALAVSIITILGGFVAAVDGWLSITLAELKPNGGTSLRDEQNRQGDTIKRLESRIDEIYSLLLNRR
jgi:hypothetical protein